MPRYVTSVRSPWSVQRAFDYLSDLEHFAQWDPGVTRAVQVAGEGPGLGAAYDVSVKSAGSNMTLRYETILFDSPRRIDVLAQSSSLRSYDVMTFEDREADGCVVTYTAELNLFGVKALANPLLSIFFKRIGDRAAKGLQRVLEARVDPS